VRVHHLSCGTFCPRPARLLAPAGGGWTAPTKLVAHCLLIESGSELVLVDTGLGLADAENPKRIPLPTRLSISPQPSIAETAIRQVEALGLEPGDVRHIITTHLDFDHAGGLADFPHAEVHLHHTELQTATSPPLSERLRYMQAHWAHGPRWVKHAVSGEEWFGFESVRLLESLDAEIALVPLLGHSRGHSGVAVRDERGWLLHCGDAYFSAGEVATPPSCPRGLSMFENLVGSDNAIRRQNQARLRDLAREHGDEVRLICSHDESELEREQNTA
jgi:glyoxylase-like metal-dependent hydrolase (beta-lactamase superfamily II)